MDTIDLCGRCRMFKRSLLALLWVSTIAAGSAYALPLTQLQVRIITGGVDMAAGSVVELRLYEAHHRVRLLPLTHGEAWPRDSTRVIPLTLTEPIEPNAILRLGLYYRAASPLAIAWQIVSAEVELPGQQNAKTRLLGASLSGAITREGELATAETADQCVADTDCDDHRRCSGAGHCAPGNAGADARGCLKGLPVSCPVNQVCIENQGCRGMSTPVHPP
ncbi:MAG: hypothetical protein M3O06_07215 [Pseudomonadota bacterium]|nr:hypothetical protein [Pseudomonadota bacterium]